MYKRQAIFHGGEQVGGLGVSEQFWSAARRPADRIEAVLLSLKTEREDGLTTNTEREGGPLALKNRTRERGLAVEQAKG